MAIANGNVLLFALSVVWKQSETLYIHNIHWFNSTSILTTNFNLNI